MSQNSRNQPGENKQGPDRSDYQIRKRNLEGFEGMNYEQVRKPYHPQRGQERESPEKRDRNRN